MQTTTCPRCGLILAAGSRPKGQGKATGAEQTRLSKSQISTLNILRELNARNRDSSVPMREVWYAFRQERVRRGELSKFPTTHLVGFWLSALLGAGFVEMFNRKIETVDKETQTIRFIKKPTWSLSRNYLDGSIRLGEGGQIIKGES